MSDIRLDPYLYFKGQSREAMDFYQSIFGGTVDVMSYADVPGDMPGAEDIPKDWLMHAALKDADVMIMASDTLKASPTVAKIDLALSGGDEPRLREIFDKLSEGGTVNTPLQKMFWGDFFGALTDKYGVNWMFNITQT